MKLRLDALKSKSTGVLLFMLFMGENKYFAKKLTGNEHNRCFISYFCRVN